MPAVGLPSNNPRFWSCPGRHLPYRATESLTTRAHGCCLSPDETLDACAGTLQESGLWDRVCVPRIQLAEEPHAATAAANATNHLPGRRHHDDHEAEDRSGANKCDLRRALCGADNMSSWP